jgi:sulfur-carrier protein
MHVTVKLFASLQRGRFDTKEFELSEGKRTRDILGIMGIQESEAALIFINNTHAELDAILNDGDTLAFFPPVGGG